MMMMQSSVLTLLLAAAVSLMSISSNVVSAFPQGAPSCTAGVAVSAPHTTRNAAGNGTVEDGGFQVVIGGTALVASGAAQATTFSANTPLTIEIIGATPDAVGFKGHFVRLGPGTSGVATPEAFSDPVAGQILSACTADGIAGFTHTDNTPKTSASATLTFPDATADTDIPLDVTIVVANCDPSSTGDVVPCDPTDSTYYYSQYLIAYAAADTGAGTTVPGPAPTDTTPAPVAPGTPTEATTVPAPAPTETTMAPTEEEPSDDVGSPGAPSPPSSYNNPPPAPTNDGNPAPAPAPTTSTSAASTNIISAGFWTMIVTTAAYYITAV